MSRINPLEMSVINRAIRALRNVFTGATASADGASGQVTKPLKGDQDKFLTGGGIWKNERFRGPHTIAQSYAAGDCVTVHGVLAYANAAIAANTAFAWGKTGSTWTPALDANVSWQGVYDANAVYSQNQVVMLSSTQSLLYRSLIARNGGKNITDTTAWVPYHPMVDMLSLVNSAASTSGTQGTVISKVLLEAVQILPGLISGTPTIQLDLNNGLVIFNTTAPNSGWILDVRASATQTLNELLSIGQSVTFTHLVSMGATAYMPSSTNIDGTARVERWSGGLKPTAGIPSAINVFSYTIIKTADNAFTLLCDHGSFK